MRIVTNVDFSFHSKKLGVKNQSRIMRLNWMRWSEGRRWRIGGSREIEDDTVKEEAFLLLAKSFF